MACTVLGLFSPGSRKKDHLSVASFTSHATNITTSTITIMVEASAVADIIMVVDLVEEGITVVASAVVDITEA